MQNHLSQNRQPRRTEQILVANDDVTMRALVRTLLERAGYKIVEAANETIALQALVEAPTLRLTFMGPFASCITGRLAARASHVPVLGGQILSNVWRQALGCRLTIGRRCIREGE